jgi:DNA polymerase I
MNNKWLILDCNFLCHRAKHATGGLSSGNTPTGVIYGFLKTVTALQESFNTDKVVFCWDSRFSKRKELYPDYKNKRSKKYKEWTDEEAEFEREFRKQMKDLRKYHLKKIGYRNIFCQKGLEGDDVMASVCKDLPSSSEAIIITSDKDLLQCIKYNVSMNSLSKDGTMALQDFKIKYGITPREWGMLKAIAGCSTDEVAGVKGVGEITAIKYLKGELGEHTKAYKNIISPEGVEIYKRNRKLVILPFKGTRHFRLKEDELSKKGWKSVMKALGMESLKDKGPVSNRRKRKAGIH